MLTPAILTEDLRTIPALLQHRATTHPDVVALQTKDESVTTAALHADVERLAAGFHALGVRPGEVVPVVLPNGADFVRVWFALTRLGAVAGLVNTALRGPALTHALGLMDGRTLVVDEAYLTTVIGAAGRPDRYDHVVRRGELPTLASDPAGLPAAPVRPADPAMVVFTSGSTGPAKGCVLPHRYAVRQAELLVEHLGLRADDVLYSPFPLFHIDAAVLTVMPALVLGTTAAVAERFSVSGFWADIRRFGATVFDFMGATLTMLHQQPTRADDAANPARLAWGVPVPDFAAEFERRFGLRLVELYGSTDAGLPMYQPLAEPRRPGTCGRAIPSYDVSLFDDDDQPVPPGAVGEIVVRPGEPSLMADGYLGMAEATLAARRNLWFHTGDLARRDADGHYSFVGRRAEAIRRRGENVSAFEVEEVVKLHPAVRDAAAFGVPSDLTEDDVMVAVVPRPGLAFDPADLVAFCRERLARHQVPRYVDVVDALPRTPTEKVEKAALRTRGVTASTWDVERPLTHPSGEA